jgi:succinate-acetate transporter protein
MTRIVLRPIGSPMPLGFFTVAIDSVLVSAPQWGLLPAVDRRAVALILFPAFVVQVISRVAAVLGFLLAAVAMYTAFALLMEDSRGREVLPIGRLGMARHATHRSLAMQLRDIERQAGVRRTL